MDLEPIIAYPPVIPRGVIKEELLEEKEGDEQPNQVITYPPIATGRETEELESVVNQEESNVEEHQVLCY